MTTYPTTIDTYTHPNPNDPRSGTTSLSTFHGNLQDAVTAIETKVGANSSVDNTSFDYKLSGVTTGDKAVSKTGTETLSSKTLTAPKINIGSDVQGDMYYRDSGGLFQRLPAGANGTIISYTGGLPVVIPNPAASNGSTTALGVYQEATQAQVDAKTQVGSTGADLTVNPSTLRATKYNDGVTDTGSSTAYAIAPSPVITAYANEQEFTWKAVNTNTTTTPTLNVNSLGAKTIINPDGSALRPGQIPASGIMKTVYDGTNMQLVSANAPSKYSSGKFGSTATTIAHNLGIVPKFVRVTGTMIPDTGSSTCFCIGTYDGTNTNTVGLSFGALQSSTTNIVVIQHAAGSTTTATITFDATNLTFAFTGANGGNYLWEAFA